MVQFDQAGRTRVHQRSQFSERVRLALLGQGSPLPLLMDNPVPVSMVIITVDQSHLDQMGGSVTVAGLPVQLSGSGFLFWRRGWFGLGWWFGLPQGGPPFTFPPLHLVLVSQVPLSFTRSLGF